MGTITYFGVQHPGSVNYTASHHAIMCYFFKSCGTLPVLRLQLLKGQLVAVPACMRHNCFTSIILFWWKAKIVTDMENCLIPQPYFMDCTSGMTNYNSAKKLFSGHCKRDVMARPWRDPLTGSNRYRKIKSQMCVKLASAISSAFFWQLTWIRCDEKQSTLSTSCHNTLTNRRVSLPTHGRKMRVCHSDWVTEWTDLISPSPPLRPPRAHLSTRKKKKSAAGLL